MYIVAYRGKGEKNKNLLNVKPTKRKVCFFWLFLLLASL